MARKSQRITKQDKANLSVETKASASPSPEPASRNRGRPAAKARRVDTSPDVEGEYSTKGLSKPDKVASAPRRRGKLHQMLDMPLDVIMEICVHLGLREMLWLSRLSKAFNKFFTSRTTQYIWKAAALNVPGLPPCPEGLTEIAYASLLFDTHCHNCYSKNCYYVYWGCRVRLCKKCYCDLAVRGRNYYNPLYPHHLEDLLYVYHVDLNGLVPPLVKKDNSAVLQYKPHLDKFLKAFNELPEDKEKRKEFLVDCQVSTRAILKTVPAFIEWDDRCKSTRADELDDIRQARQDAIEEKLKEDGWQLELDFLETSEEDRKNFLKLPEVRKTQALSPRIWTTIKDSVIKFVQEIRDKRLREIYIESLPNRVYKLGKAIKAVVDGIDRCELTPQECELRIPELFDMVGPNKEDFDVEDLQPTVRTLVVDYLSKRDGVARRELMVALREECGLDDSVDPFSLAVGSCFRCAQCNHAFNLGEAVRHVCRSNWKYPLDKPEGMSNDYFRTVRDSLEEDGYGLDNQFMWCVENFRPTLKQAVAVIRACGFDVKTATVKDLDGGKDLRLLCTNHRTWNNYKIEYAPIMNWRTAAFTQPCCNLHSKTPHSYPTYERATEKQVAAVKTSEEACTAAQLKNNAYGYMDFTCVHCSELFETKWYATYHAKNKHDIAEPGENDWTTVCRDEPIVPSNIYLVPTQVNKNRYYRFSQLIKNNDGSIVIYDWEKW
ncbi:hypothetical protein BDY19DRAFT_947876 [Irpex rosettiformis]|uniref:Uncharacterized protein n=1 Tax=Irpex rosettiformis TaxID=378272 RepID=A0ACB8U2L9_9APHY|nr:hypothetical protein BDY19DRAFT_947876 [Irpex rosettiformis]